MQRKVKYFLSLLFLFIPLFSQGSNIYLVFRNDDISIKSNPIYEYDVLLIFRKYDIKPLYAVIPALGGDKLSSEMPIVDSLKSWHKKGWIDISMHGYTHDKAFTNFSYNEQYNRILAGKKILEDVIDIPVSIFCPPWNAANKNTLLALYKNNITSFSGYLGEKPIEGLNYLNCNCNLINGPLELMADKINIAKQSSNDVLIVALYHTSYDFREINLNQLDTLLFNTTKNEKVIIKSFSELLNENNNFLNLVNDAGYRLKLLKYNKYIRKIFLKLPLFSNYCINQTKTAEEYYWTGNYSKVIDIYNEIMICIEVIILIFIIIISIIIVMSCKHFNIRLK